MAFWWPNSLGSPIYILYFTWITNILFLLLWFNKWFHIFGNSYSLQGIYYDQFVFYNISLIIRAFLIAVRYGYCSSLRFSLMNKSVQETKYLSRDLLLVGWANYSREGIDSEIEAVLWRKQIEENFFNLAFIESSLEK